MAKDKLKRFKENLSFENFVQPEFDEIFNRDHRLKGKWSEEFFKNDNPIILELGCGKGEYTVNLGELYPNKNFIGIDIKGARMWRGAKTATENEMNNVGFIRTRIEFINSFFAENEVSEIWITFPDPQLRKRRIKKRLTSPLFLDYYARLLKPDGYIHLKTDSKHLHDYTKAVAEANSLPIECAIEDVYGQSCVDEVLSIQTFYESHYLKKGKKITYLRFSLNDRKEFVEPEFAPDLVL